jgi:D-Tyr-tRNAtyr deacylase
MLLLFVIISSYEYLSFLFSSPQFTLDVTLKGNKPDFHEAMGPDLSQQFYHTFLEQLGAAYKPEKIKGKSFSETWNIDTMLRLPMYASKLWA